MLSGSRFRKVDGLEKSTGQAQFTDDLVFPGMLHGKILRSPHPNARILSIDAGEALAMEGVQAVITGRDMPVKYGIIPWTPDESPLCVERVRYIGDGVAAAAAVDEIMDSSDMVVEGEYFFEGSTHTPIEPHCAIGQYEGNGELTVWSATQVPHYLHRELARVLDVDVARVRVCNPPWEARLAASRSPSTSSSASPSSP